MCVSLKQLQRQLHLAVCACQDVPHAVGREKAAALGYVRTKRFPLPFVAQGDSVLLLFFLEFELRCGSDSRGGYQVLALHCSLIAQRKKNNMVFVTACLSMAVKLAVGRWAGVPEGEKRGRKAEWEKQGRRE